MRTLRRQQRRYGTELPSVLELYKSLDMAADVDGFRCEDNLAVLRSENSTASSAPGFGFWIRSSVRSAIDSTSTLKPFANNAINLGSASFAPQTVYAATSFDTLTQGRQNFEL